MNNTIQQVLDNLRDLEEKLEQELHKGSEHLQYTIQNGKIRFEQELRERHRALRTSTVDYIRNARWLVVLTAPVIYSVALPLVLLDLFVTVYQSICFPIYGIARVPRASYFVFDRAKLDYLNGIEKFNCVYCSYGNGVIAYSREIAARTEQYWCPIKHAQAAPGSHDRYPLFTDFGDAEQYRRSLGELQRNLGDDTKKRDDVE